MRRDEAIVMMMVIGFVNEFVIEMMIGFVNEFVLEMVIDPLSLDPPFPITASTNHPTLPLTRMCNASRPPEILSELGLVQLPVPQGTN